MKLTIESGNDLMTGIFEGRLDTTVAPQVGVDMKPLLDNADKNIVLDCSKLEFISSSGLRLFLTLRKATMPNKKDVIIRGASDDIKQVFKITGFATLFKFE